MTATLLPLPDWTRAHGGPPCRGFLRQSADDFSVTEVLGFTPDGNGEHDYLWLEKRHTNTRWLARRLAAHARIPVRDVGFSGLKDRHAVARQWFSVRRPGGTPADWSAFTCDGVTILEASRNTRKLRRGAHAGNRFRICLRQLTGPVAKLNETLDLIACRGVPNFFGEQRFGHGGRNLDLALALFAGKRLAREKRATALSAARGYLFNLLLQKRVQERSWDRLLPGDIVALDGTGSVFTADTVDGELTSRCEQMDIHPTGTLWGRSAGALPVLPGASTARLEELARGLEAHSSAARRSLRLPVRELQWSLGDDSLTLEFYIGRGGYATAVLRELADYTDVATQSGSSNT